MENGIENEVLKELANRLVMKRQEIVEFLKGKVENPAVAAEVATKALKTKEFITYVIPIGKSCIVITQKGIRHIEGR